LKGGESGIGGGFILFICLNSTVYRLLRPNAHGHPLRPRCVLGDKVPGSVLSLDQSQNEDEARSTVPVSFTKNRREVCNII